MLNKSLARVKLPVLFHRASKALIRGSTFFPLFACCATSLAWAVKAQDEAPQCLEEVFNVSKEMQGDYGLNVSPPATRAIDHPMNPFPGSYAREFLMVTQYGAESSYAKKTTFNAENFMNSPGIQLRLAKRVARACPLTSQIIFGISKSGYGVLYYRMPSGQVRGGIPLECGEGNGNSALPWGYFYSC